MQTSRNSEQIDQLVTALAAARLEFPAINRNKGATIIHKSGKSHSYKYATLDEILDQCCPVLGKHGLVFFTQLQSLDHGLLVISTLAHVSGQWIGSEVCLPETLQGQDLGTAITYVRRYSGTAMFGIHPDEDDDAAPEPQRATPRQTSTAADNGSPEANAHQAELEKERLANMHALFALVKSCDLTERDLRDKIAQIKGPAKFKDLSNVQIKFLSEYFQGVKRSQEPPATSADEIDVPFDEMPASIYGKEGEAPPRPLEAPPAASDGHEGTSPSKPAVYIDVRTVEVPTPEVDANGKVTKAWMDLLPLRAEALGALELCANIMKRYPKMTIKQYRDLWDDLAHATAKGNAR
jgi:ERF superfamily